MKIFGESYEVKANVEVIDSYSAHADYNELIRILSCQNKEKVKKIFLVYGEHESKISFKDKLGKEEYKEVVIRYYGKYKLRALQKLIRRLHFH